MELTQKILSDIEQIKQMLKDHERRISKLDGKSGKEKGPQTSTWYESGSTIEKIVILIKEGFFDKNRTITNLIAQLKSQDYHFHASDLTLPLRKIVRKGLLIKTKDLADGTTSKSWTYIKN